MGQITITIQTPDEPITVQSQDGETIRLIADLSESINLINVLPFKFLTEREREILRYIAAGLQYKTIAQTLGIDERTARTHAYSITNKLHVPNGISASIWAILAGQVTPQDVISLWWKHLPHAVKRE